MPAVICCSLLLVPSARLWAATHSAAAPASGPEPPWSFVLRGAYVAQLDTDLDQGGSFSIDRFFVEGGPVYSPDYRRSISLLLGYGYDGYDFSGIPAVAGSPWEDIHSLRFSAPVRWGTADQWTFFAAPVLRLAAESGADWDQAVTGGGFAGFSYRCSDSLSLGPGIGILSQLEDNVSLFPLLFIQWQITDRLSLETGRGLAASRGPGLGLNWQATEELTFAVGARYEKQRFRLDDDGTAPDGIGEKTSYPLFLGATYDLNEDMQASLVAGTELGGELRQEDQEGRLLAEDDYDPAFFGGLTLRARF
jgi:hypothetical protein